MEDIDALSDLLLKTYYAEFGSKLAAFFVDLLINPEKSSDLVFNEIIWNEKCLLPTFDSLLPDSITGLTLEHQIRPRLERLNVSVADFESICAERSEKSQLFLQPFVKEEIARRARILNNDPDPATVQSERMIICRAASDVHLGRGNSRESEFYEWLGNANCQDVVLNGDILDFWISPQRSGPEIADIILAAWEILYKQLEKLKNERGITFHYLPGNHDYPVFLLEACERIPWCSELVYRVPLLTSIWNATREMPLTRVVQMHYPFFSLDIEGAAPVLFTHGHYTKSYWKLLNHHEQPDVITGIAIAMSLEYAAGLRRILRLADNIAAVRKIQEVSIKITSAIARAHAAAFAHVTQRQGNLVALVNHAFAIYCGGTPLLTRQERVLVLQALGSLSTIANPQAYANLRRRHQDTRVLLTYRSNANNITLRDATSEPELRTFGSFLITEQLVVGHDHIPRSEKPIHDIGGFVEDISTSMIVRRNGEIEFTK